MTRLTRECFSTPRSASEHVEDQINDVQDSWQEVDPDEYSYESWFQELVALGGVVGTERRGLSADTLASLPSVTYNTKDMQDGNTEQCVICRVGFEEGESLVALPCKHSYHPDCINQSHK
ncbi:E3 ubiquitin ligase BIG BROTHER-related isoform X2 [Aegilops tauschii subsp. strangulata]|uniref:E3 ubiquitin ligase BIG BROTHER-related isoform X2 n=1 Tax=Aegilops tauschii subsp. strangulata TaxID=200361 RepID=UPI003CC8702D